MVPCEIIYDSFCNTQHNPITYMEIFRITLKVILKQLTNCCSTDHQNIYYTRTNIINMIYIYIFSEFSRFVDIGVIIDYHCLNFLFINYLYVFNGHDRKHFICSTIYTVLPRCYNFNTSRSLC